MDSSYFNSKGELLWKCRFSRKWAKEWYPSGRIKAIFGSCSSDYKYRPDSRDSTTFYDLPKSPLKEVIEAGITILRRGRTGRVITKGELENKRRVGRWLVDNNIVYFIDNAMVSRELYETPPEKLVAKEILVIKNTQLRAVMVKRMGYEKLLKDIGGKSIHKQDDMELYEMDNPNGDESRADKTLKLLKVCCPTTGTYYTLRVPPQVKKCEEARQWTFHKELAGNWQRRENYVNNHVKFTKET